MDEVQRPAGIGLGFDQDRRTRADSTPPGFPLADRKSFLAIEPVDAVDAGRLSVPPKQDEQPSITEASPLIGEVTKRVRPALTPEWTAS